MAQNIDRMQIEQLPLNRNLKALRNRVRNLRKIIPKRLNDAICDIIDLKGYSIAVLLDGLKTLPPSIQEMTAKKIEDFMFFHPQKCKKLLPRLISSMKEADHTCRPYLLSAVADITACPEISCERLAEIGNEAVEVLLSETDFLRKAKAVELISHTGLVDAVPSILSAMGKALGKIEMYANYNFVETCLFALKKLGGENLLRLLVNPTSVNAARQFRIEWRDRTENQIKNVLQAIAKLNTDFAQFMLKVIDLSEFGTPFASMVHEGLTHADKWVRQAATASMGRMTYEASLERLLRMLDDPSTEVKLMAITSLGSFSIEISGEILTRTALSESESNEVKMNALYALLAQKNLNAISSLIRDANQLISVNAQGAAAFLIPRDEGIAALLNTFSTVPMTYARELFHYMNELALPEDLKILLKTLENLKETARKELFLKFLTAFLSSKAGPNLKSAVSQLEPLERKAVEALIALPSPETEV